MLHKINGADTADYGTKPKVRWTEDAQFVAAIIAGLLAGSVVFTFVALLLALVVQVWKVVLS